MSNYELPKNWKELAGLQPLNEAGEDDQDKAISKVNDLVTALRKISKIKNKMHGHDWDEIEEARDIAYKVLKKFFPNEPKPVVDDEDD